MAPKMKTQVDEMDRGIYDIKNKFTFRRKTEEGLTPEIVRQISEEKMNLNGCSKKDWKLLKYFTIQKILNGDRI